MNRIGNTSIVGNKKAIIATLIVALFIAGLLVYGISIK